MEKATKRGIIYLLISSILFGILPTLGKFIFMELNPILLAFFRMALSVVMFLIILLVRKELNILKTITRRDMVILCVVGALIFALANLFFVIGIDLTTASIGSLMGNMNKIFFVLFSFFLLKKPVTWRKVLGIALAMLGVFFIVWNGRFSDASWDIFFLIGYLLLILTAILGGVYFTANERYVEKYNTLPMLLIIFIMASISIMPFTFPYFLSLGMVTPFTIILLIIAGIACTSIPYFLFSESLKHLDASTASSVSLTTPLFGTLFATLFLGEIITIFFIIGAVLILGGNFLTIKGEHNLN